MKVCVTVKNPIWFDPRVKKQVFSYVESGVDVVCVGVKEPRYDALEISKIPCDVLLADLSIDAFSSSRTFISKIKRELKTNREMYHLMVSTNPDVIHANDLNALIPAYKAAKKLKCKLVYDSHEIFVENPWIANNWIVKMIWSYFEKKIVKHVDAFVCVSNAAKDYFVKKYNPKRILVVTNCVSKNRIITNINDKKEKKEVLNHGQFYRGRGYDLMIRTAPRVKDLTDVYFALRGYGVLEDQLKSMSNDLNTNNVFFYPPVRIEELIPYASKAWIGLAITEPISLNFKLSISNKIFEYAAAGLPVIMSDIPEHRFLNEKYNFGVIIENNDEINLEKAIRYFYENPDFYHQCHLNAIEMSKIINWENEFSKLLDTELEILNERN